ncbi:MAG TPA: hypothetical protein DEP27_03825 [Ruminococcaceae bacterium]|nr:hypothetical protein [Oscillospiraceae bacterium]
MLHSAVSAASSALGAGAADGAAAVGQEPVPQLFLHRLPDRPVFDAAVPALRQSSAPSHAEHFCHFYLLTQKNLHFYGCIHLSV